MFEITESALINIKEYLRQQNIESAVRIIMSSGCSGSSLGLAIDDVNESDNVFDHGGVCFLVAKELSIISGAIKIDFVEDKSGSGGFAVTSENPLPSESCGCSCSSRIMRIIRMLGSGLGGGGFRPQPLVP
jgi:iron-sulfur cluster assembly protein